MRTTSKTSGKLITASTYIASYRLECLFAKRKGLGLNTGSFLRLFALHTFHRYVHSVQLTVLSPLDPRVEAFRLALVDDPLGKIVREVFKYDLGRRRLHHLESRLLFIRGRPCNIIYA